MVDVGLVGVVDNSVCEASALLDGVELLSAGSIDASLALSTGGVVGRYLYRLESSLLNGGVVENRDGIFGKLVNGVFVGLVEGEYLLSGQDSVSGCWSSKYGC